MGEVYRARDTRLQRDVALKFVAPDIASPKIRQRLVREARAASALNHPHICTVYEIGEHDGQPFIAMEYLEGHTLHTQLQSGPLGNDELIDAACQIVDALAAPHPNAVVHPDLKPGNLFITKRGDAKILDFGLAKIEQSDGHTLNALTQDGATMGTA